MKKKLVSLFFFSLILSGIVKAQGSNSDSLNLAKTLKELLSICLSIDFADPKVSELGLFYKAAPYIVYRGEDKKRAWKDFANYTKAEEKKGVDQVCLRINETVNRDTGYKIIKYFKEKESEGTWYVLLVSYLKNGKPKQNAFAFLKIDGRFGLGDID